MAFLKKRTINESITIMVTIAETCKKLGGPLTNQLFQLVRDHRWLDVIDFYIDYTWAFSRNDFLYARQVQALVSKQDFLDIGVNKEEVAFKKFLASEDKCRETNERFEKSPASLNWDVNAVMYTASQKIARILSSVPSIGSLDLSFGPGATTSTKSLHANPRVKLNSRLECSANLMPIVRELLEELPHLSAYHSSAENDVTFSVPVEVVSGKLSFVPKDSRTHRSIVVEPILNGLIQKGIGSVMKKRLLRAGLDLSDQTRNQSLAREGSINGTLATIDLSSASDNISRAVVWDLLPYDWAVLLDQCRSDVVIYKGQKYLLEKFSSMGNAYTFELESLIFYSLALATCHQLGLDTRNVSVYGDDIIVPVAAYDLLEEVLLFCGFELNSKKSFKSGPFRESCGADFFDGMDIRPYYLRFQVNDRVLYNMHNFFVRHCEFRLASIVLKETHEPSRLFGPDGYGDGHLIGEHSLRSSRRMKRDGFCGGVFDTYSLKPQFFKLALPTDYIYPIYSVYVRGEPHHLDVGLESDPDRVRGTRGYTKISIYTLASGIFSDNLTADYRKPGKW